MAAERDLELLDDYLANRLNAQERSAFEQKLNANSELKAEFDLQQHFIRGIQKARVAELKGMMNNIAVPAIQPGSTTVAAKIAAWVAAVSIVGAGFYWYINQSETDGVSKPAEKDQSIQPSEKPTEEQPSAPDEDKPEEDKPHEDSPVVSEQEASAEQKPSETPKPVKKKKTTVVPAEPKIEVYDPTQEAENEQTPLTEEGNATKLNVNHEIAVEIDAENKKYSFHYQFRNGKLILYGPFEKDLYEIMEFFSDDKRTIFLYFEGNFYLLKDNNEKLKDLTPIQNPDLIRKLKEYRN